MGAPAQDQIAPAFRLPSADGELVALEDRLKNEPAVVTFYRGGWCPYCNIALRGLQSHLPEIMKLGASLIAISPELPDQTCNTREKLALEFDVLSDRDSVVARRYGLVHRVADAARQRLLALGRDLVRHNGSDAWELPVTATYIINQRGMVKFAHVAADYRSRLDPSLIVKVLQGTQDLPNNFLK